MKKMIALATAVIFTLSLGTAFAQQAAPGYGAPEVEAETKTEKKTAKKAKKKAATKKKKAAEKKEAPAAAPAPKAPGYYY